MSPEQLGRLVDDYYRKRENRLALQREVDKLDKDEKELKKLIIEQLRLEKISSIGGLQKRATLQIKNKPSVTSWPNLYSHIQKTGEFDLLQRRLTETAVAVRWEDKIVIPGVEAFPVEDLSLSNI
jgi:hypothetical protein